MKTDSSFEEKFIDLDRLFVNQDSLSIKKNGLLATDELDTKSSHLNPAIVNQIAMHLGLTYVLENHIDGNLCFANNSEIRQEFKQTFTNEDILNFVHAVLHSPIFVVQHKVYLETKTSKIPYPKDTKTFWEWVEIGSKMH